MTEEEKAVLDAALAFARSGESYMGPAANKLHWAAKALLEAQRRGGGPGGRRSMLRQ